MLICPTRIRVGPAVVRFVHSGTEWCDCSARSLLSSVRRWQPDIRQHHGQWGTTICPAIHDVCRGHQWLDVSQQVETKSVNRWTARLGASLTVVLNLAVIGVLMKAQIRPCWAITSLSSAVYKTYNSGPNTNPCGTPNNSCWTVVVVVVLLLLRATLFKKPMALWFQNRFRSGWNLVWLFFKQIRIDWRSRIFDILS